MNKVLLKELFIILLLFIAVMFTLAILFYDSIFIETEEISSVQDIYGEELSNKIPEVAGFPKNRNNNNSLYLTKKVTKEDIEAYEAESIYETGKKNPFSENSDSKNDEEEVDITDSIIEQVEDEEVNDELDKTETNSNGRFFENKKSK